MAPSCGGFSFPYRNRVQVLRKPCQSDDAKNGKNAYPPGERPHFL
nr:MAG TPA: hypothetical protein [Caudoviricetes sp.]